MWCCVSTQILFNLLENALKFTTKGSIDIMVAVCETDPEKIIIRVKDTGCGIPKNMQTSIFAVFQQVSLTSSIRF